jgi:hypothetical protein
MYAVATVAHNASAAKYRHKSFIMFGPFCFFIKKRSGVELVYSNEIIVILRREAGNDLLFLQIGFTLKAPCDI